jgi:Ig-like domain CHU_C associated
VVRVCGTPSITAQPQNKQIASGASAQLSVTATSCEPATYQWYRGNVADTSNPAGTGSTLNTGALTATTTYWARITDSSSGQANSSAAVVTVCGAPAITAQPQNANYSGTPVTLTVAASGCAPFSYQWYRGDTNDTANPVGTSQSFTVPPITVTTKYWVRVTDSVNASVNSTAATVTVFCTPVITSHPQPETTYSGSPITLSVSVAEGCPPYQYQWYRGQVSNRSQGVGDNSPSFSPPAPTSTTLYWVLVTDSSGGEAESDQATVRCAPATVSVQPGSIFYAGAPVTLTATPNGCGSFNYAWYAGLSGDVNNSTPLTSGPSASSYTTPALTATARYWVRLFYDNSAASVDSGTITLTVPLSAPATLTATYTGSGINVSWSASAGVHHYELQRLSNGVWTPLNLSSPTATSYPDTAVVSNAAYVYRVRAVDAYGESASAYASDLATTMSFATIQQHVTFVAFSHFEQIRTAINLIRAARGDGDLGWAQLLQQAGYANAAVPAQNGLIKAIHLLALRDGMNKARAAVALPSPGYTDSNVTTSTPIRAVHLTDLQQRAQ